MTPEILLRYATQSGRVLIDLAPPLLSIDGVDVVGNVHRFEQSSTRRFHNGVTEHLLRGEIVGHRGLWLTLVLRIPERGPVVRWRFTWESDRPRKLTKPNEKDRLRYTCADLANLPEAHEITLSEFSEVVHSYTLREREVHQRQFDASLKLMGPILTASGSGASCLLAYEHGTQTPHAYVEFALSPDRQVELRAKRGNYLRDQHFGPDAPYRSIWLQVAGVEGDLDAMASAYREFIANQLPLHAASRQPLIFYNTWNYQERLIASGQSHLNAVSLQRMLDEIDVAHRMGVDVFVLDVGWFNRAGDWDVDLERFPDGLLSIKAALDARGMQLGLWFEPMAAGVNSQTLAEHGETIMAWDGKRNAPRSLWGTRDPVHNCCLVSRFGDAFAKQLIRLHREVGVTYFKWDAVNLWGCNAPGHGHGDEHHTPTERTEGYEFQLVQAMVRIVEQLTEACPQAIVDFDVTESYRAVGLAWLSAGKYFLINNGPYHQSYDLPPAKGNSNLFFWPGQARTWICRSALSYDRWIPSNLFLVHYLPDEKSPFPKQMFRPQVDSLEVNLASLILGGNGVWGDLPALPSSAVERFRRTIDYYNVVKDAVTRADPVRTGDVGACPEIHEKLHDGKGVVVIFSTCGGRYEYVTRNVASTKFVGDDGVDISFTPSGTALLRVHFEKAGARVLFFGAEGA